MRHGIKSLFLSLAIGLTSNNSNAALISSITGGESLVYSSLGNLTWTGDANLLGSMMSKHSYSTIVKAIIATTPSIANRANIYDTPAFSGFHNLSAADFSASELGRTSWFGAIAYTNYLNIISYGGRNNWLMPTAGNNPQIGDRLTGIPFETLFYKELGGNDINSLPDTDFFTNEQAYGYWLDADLQNDSDYAWFFYTGNDSGFESNRHRIWDKNQYLYAWAVSPVDTAITPIPGAIWLFLSGIFGLLGLRIRGRN
jgi:hypothetical protein